MNTVTIEIGDNFAFVLLVAIAVFGIIRGVRR